MVPHRLFVVVALFSIAKVAHAQDGWHLFRGNAQRTGAAATLPAFEKRVAWQRPLLLDKHEGIAEVDNDQAAKALIENLRKDADASLLPGFFPIISGDLCVYRGHRDARAVGLKTVTVVDDVLKEKVVIPAGSIVWQAVPSTTDLSVLLEIPRMRREFDLLTDVLQRAKQDHWLWANPMIGAISTDDEMTYVIHDLPIPDHHYLAAAKRKGVANQDGLKPYTTRNTLSAYSTLYGKLTWEIGPDIRNSDGAFQESFFLGAPLAIDKNLYVLDESPTITMRLRVFDTTKRKLGQPPLLEKSLAIGTILLGESAKYDVVRRTQPLHLAYAGDLLVCPTHGGYIVGVDRKKLTVLWKYRYREELALSPAQPFWQAASPVIHKDSIVFTAADAPDVHCIDFEGKKRWIARSPNTDLYLATVHEDIALVVGKTYCRALSMKNGNEVWKLETGLPAGVGVKDGATYYLPLKRDDGPTIWAIDLVKGTKARALKTPYPDALGNLILHRGMFVSQSVTHIAAFPLP